MLSSMSGYLSGFDLNVILQCQNLVLTSGAFQVKKGLNLVAMSPTPIEEQQFCLVNKSHKKALKKFSVSHLVCPFNGKW